MDIILKSGSWRGGGPGAATAAATAPYSGDLERPLMTPASSANDL